MSSHLIQSAQELEECCAEISDEQWLTIDTEFMRERTYYSQLCLIQIGTAKSFFCVDVLADMPLAPLFDVLCHQPATRVLHAARQDLEIFFQQQGSFTGPVFDTQIAGGLLGHDAQIGYAGLIKALIGKELEKGYQRANWAARPLPQGQLEYALDDVRYLSQAYPILLEQLNDAGRLEWALEDCARLLNPDLHATHPEQAFLRIGAVRALPAQEQNIVKMLAQWREVIAQQKDKPRNWIASDSTLIYMAQVRPDTAAALQKVKGISPALIDQESNALLQAIQTGIDAQGGQLVSKPAPLTDGEQKLYKELKQLLEHRAKSLNINTPVLGTRKDVEQLLRGNENSGLLSGWRKQEIGEEMLAQL